MVLGSRYEKWRPNGRLMMNGYYFLFLWILPILPAAMLSIVAIFSHCSFAGVNFPGFRIRVLASQTTVMAQVRFFFVCVWFITIPGIGFAEQSSHPLY